MKSLLEHRRVLAILVGSALVVVIVGLVSESSTAVAWTGAIVGVLAGIIIAGMLGPAATKAEKPTSPAKKKKQKR